MKFLLLPVFLLSGLFSLSKSANEGINRLYDNSIRTLDSNPDSAFYFAEELLKLGRQENDVFGRIQSNFIMGWLADNKQGNYGKALIYYLEALRYSDGKSLDESLRNDVLSIRKNIAILYLQFNDYSSAENHILDAIEDAERGESMLKVVKLMSTLSDIQVAKGLNTEALAVIEDAERINTILGDNTQKAHLLNAKGEIFKSSGEFQKAINEYLKEITLVESNPDDLRLYKAYALNNMAECHLELKQFDQSIKLFQEVIVFKSSWQDYILNRPLSFYHSFKGLGDAYYISGQLEKAEKQYLETVSFVDTLGSTSNPYYFDLYNKLANLYEQKGDFVLANKYRKVYGEVLNKHIEHQAEIEKIDKKYNLELITQRYYSLVAQQEKNRKIELYGGITIGFFLLVILGLILFNAYQRYILKSELERSIRILNI